MIDPISHIYQRIGDTAPYYKLVDEFYSRIEEDKLLRPMYPKDVTEAKRKLALFLIQRTGGETTYSDERGHPRMRGRHMPFKIGVPERDAWMRNMTAAVDSVPEFAPHREDLMAFFDHFATFMINQPPQ
ncbi:MAG TPA: globin [Drouetiella sp.]